MPRFRHIAAGKATTMGHIKRSHLRETLIPIPPNRIIEAAAKVIEPIFSLIGILKKEARALAQIRDALLPKLISGEIRVKDAEKFVEKAHA